MAAAPQQVVQEITGHLDAFKLNNPDITKSAVVLRYVQNLPNDKQLSQFLMAEIMYLYFMGGLNALYLTIQISINGSFSRRDGKRPKGSSPR